jgi:hypothetical protein
MEDSLPPGRYLGIRVEEAKIKKRQQPLFFTRIYLLSENEALQDGDLALRKRLS